MSFHKSGNPAAIAMKVTSLFWLAGAMGGAVVAEVVNRGQSWLETRRLAYGAPSLEDAVRFGRRLARTHTADVPHWGAPPPGLRDVDARLSELPAPVSGAPRWGSWGEFYAEAGLRPYLRLAEVSREARLVLHRVTDLVAEGRSDAPQPVLVKSVARIHGGLWAGDMVWAIVLGGAGTIGTLLDPSAHGGHAETDLAELALLDTLHLGTIIAGYQEISPLTDGWRYRVAVHQFHMVLVHAALYSGNYVSQVFTLARRFRGDAEHSRQSVRIRTGLAS